MVACLKPRLLVTVSGPSFVTMKTIGALNDGAARIAAKRSKPLSELMQGLNAENSSVLWLTSKCFLLTFLFIGRPIHTERS